MKKKNFVSPFAEKVLGNFQEENEENTITTTGRIDRESMAKIKYIAFLEKAKIKEVISAMLRSYVKKYEKLKGPIDLTGEEENRSLELEL